MVHLVQLIANVRENPDRTLIEKGKGRRSGRSTKEEGGEGEQSGYEGIASSVRGREKERERRTNLNTTAWHRMERECPVGGDRGDDLDSDGPEPLATVGQLSSPRFASFFEPPLYEYTHEEEIFLRRALSTACTIYTLSSRHPRHPLPYVYVYLGPGFLFPLIPPPALPHITLIPPPCSPPNILRMDPGSNFLYSGPLWSGDRDRYKLDGTHRNDLPR